MRCWVTICSFFIFLSGIAQYDPATLARQLTSTAHSDREKVTSIFRWITDNISYRIKSPGKRSGAVNIQAKDLPVETDDTTALKPLNERVAEHVLEQRVAGCDGYARLFTTLCDHAGLRSEVIVGYAKNDGHRPVLRFAVNHYWNAVFFEGGWHLLDATWASGYVDWRGDEFVKEYDSRYFLTSPDLFIQDHYPDDPRWTLLPDSKVPDEFRYSPFQQKSFSKYGITTVFPTAGIIEAAVGDTIFLQLETNGPDDQDILPDLLVDSSLFTYSPAWVFLKPCEQDGSLRFSHLHQYRYAVSSADVKWLYLIYNDDIVLRYKINVKSRKS